MKKLRDEFVTLKSKQVLLELNKFGLIFFESHAAYRVPAKRFRKSLEGDQIRIKRRIEYLKTAGLVRGFVEGKESFLEITPKGHNVIRKMELDEVNINKSERWDRKWRVVIFDISERNKRGRNFLRVKLGELGFEKIQASVYVFPFECTEVIEILSEVISEQKNVLVMLADIIQGEERIIMKFLDKGVLTKANLV